MVYVMGLMYELENLVLLLIGFLEVSVIDMVVFYVVFVSGGLKVMFYVILEVKNSIGKVFYCCDWDEVVFKCIFLEDKVYEMNDIFVNVVEVGMGCWVRIDGVVLVGKMGMINVYCDVWFVGYMGNFFIVVWFGNDDFIFMCCVIGGSLLVMVW